MATIVNFDVCLDKACDTFTLTELTGVYSSTNTGGWGAPNALTSDITVAILQVTSPGGSVYTINLLSPVSGFPSANPSFDYDLLPGDLGGMTNAADGHWQFFLYYRTAAGTVYQKTKNYLFYCNSECCVQELLADIDISCDSCDNDDKIENYTKASAFLAGLKNAARCFQTSNFDSIQAILTKLCKNSTCKSC